MRDTFTSSFLKDRFGWEITRGDWDLAKFKSPRFNIITKTSPYTISEQTKNQVRRFYFDPNTKLSYSSIWKLKPKIIQWFKSKVDMCELCGLKDELLKLCNKYKNNNSNSNDETLE